MAAIQPNKNMNRKEQEDKAMRSFESQFDRLSLFPVGLLSCSARGPKLHHHQVAIMHEYDSVVT
jgi:hypothetical protein